jgi:ribosomal protein L32E
MRYKSLISNNFFWLIYATTLRTFPKWRRRRAQFSCCLRRRWTAAEQTLVSVLWSKAAFVLKSGFRPVVLNFSY